MADIKNTASITAFGLFEFPRMPIGLHNAAQPFQHFIDVVMLGLPFVFAFKGDALVVNSSPPEHLRHLGIVLECLGEPGRTLNNEYCAFRLRRWSFSVTSLTAINSPST